MPAPVASAVRSDAKWRREGAKLLQTVLANDRTLGERLAYGRLLWVGPLAVLSAAVLLALSFVGPLNLPKVSAVMIACGAQRSGRAYCK